MKTISSFYNWLVKNVPTQMLHFLITFLTVVIIGVFSWKIGFAIAIGLSLGRESVRIPRLNEYIVRCDTLRDLLFDAIGISSGLLILLLL